MNREFFQNKIIIKPHPILLQNIHLDIFLKMAKLCKNCNSGKRWYPNSIEKIVNFITTLNVENTINFDYEIKRNIAYNLQYIEYLDLTMRELDLSNVLITETCKNFIITGISIVEAILYYIIKSKGLHRETYWKEMKTVHTNIHEFEQKKYKDMIVKYVEQATPIEEEMNFDSMIKKAESKHLLGEDHEIYTQLNHLRNIRNKVHLYLIQDKLDTDWNVFNVNKVILMKRVLLKILSSNNFNATDDQLEMFNFLKVY